MPAFSFRLPPLVVVLSGDPIEIIDLHLGLCRVTLLEQTLEVAIGPQLFRCINAKLWLSELLASFLVRIKSEGPSHHLVFGLRFNSENGLYSRNGYDSWAVKRDKSDC